MMVNALTVDVEDYFHPTEVQRSVDPSAWPSLPSRVEASTERVLALLGEHGVKGTFFVLGWVAQRHARLVQAIVRGGHEIACHSYAHQLVYTLAPQSFRMDTERAKFAIENACGMTPRLYRAPSYSITAQSLWAFDILCECGFTHDSSVYPIRHDRYGIPGFGRHAQRIRTGSGTLIEVPVATARLPGGRVAPVGGGGYFRLLPYRYTAAGLRSVNREGHPACFYFHPWELDPEQPRLASGLVSRIRTYAGLRSTVSKLERLLRDFRFSTLTSVFPTAMTEYVLDYPANALTPHVHGASF